MAPYWRRQVGGRVGAEWGLGPQPRAALLELSAKQALLSQKPTEVAKGKRAGEAGPPDTCWAGEAPVTPRPEPCLGTSWPFLLERVRQSCLLLQRLQDQRVCLSTGTSCLPAEAHLHVTWERDTWLSAL